MMPGVAAASAQIGQTPYIWVAVGPSGFLATSTSTTASSWTTQTSSFGSTEIFDVASNGLGYFVAVGNSGKIGTSFNGTDWTQQTSPFGTNAIRSVEFGNGMWVAGSDNNQLATSPDGVTWTLRTTGFPALSSITVGYGNGLWVASSSGTEIRTATDPTGTWTVRTNPGTTSRYPHYNSFAGIWNMGAGTGATNQIISSTNGTTWTLRSLPNNVQVINNLINTSNSSVIVYWYQTSTGVGDIASSTNGTSWTDRTPAATATQTFCMNLGVDDANLIVIPGAANNVQTSTDGTTWTNRTGPTTACNAICHSRVS